jgi:hypothetical protein
MQQHLKNRQHPQPAFLWLEEHVTTTIDSICWQNWKGTNLTVQWPRANRQSIGASLSALLTWLSSLSFLLPVHIQQP